jgi:hypothetical protein
MKTISHPYDYRRLKIKVKEENRLDLSIVKDILIKASHEKLTNHIEGVFSPIGKLFVILHKIHFVTGNPKTAPIIYLRIRTSGLNYETKRMTYSYDTPLGIRQGFMMYLAFYADRSRMLLPTSSFRSFLLRMKASS